MAANQSSTKPARINYRSVRERTLEDQASALEQGYNSVLELQLDELNQGLMILQGRLDKIEQVGPHALADPED